jgi:hypothetical protein
VTRQRADTPTLFPRTTLTQSCSFPFDQNRDYVCLVPSSFSVMRQEPVSGRESQKSRPSSPRPFDSLSPHHVPSSITHLCHSFINQISLYKLLQLLSVALHSLLSLAVPNHGGRECLAHPSWVCCLWFCPTSYWHRSLLCSSTIIRYSCSSGSQMVQFNYLGSCIHRQPTGYRHGLQLFA